MIESKILLPMHPRWNVYAKNSLWNCQTILFGSEAFGIWRARPLSIPLFVLDQYPFPQNRGENYTTKWDGPYPREGFSKECSINWVSHQSTNRSQEKGDSELICERPNWHCPTSLGSLDKTAHTKSEGILCMRSRNHTYQHKTRLTIPATVFTPNSVKLSISQEMTQGIPTL